MKQPHIGRLVRAFAALGNGGDAEVIARWMRAQRIALERP